MTPVQAVTAASLLGAALGYLGRDLGLTPLAVLGLVLGPLAAAEMVKAARP